MSSPTKVSGCHQQSWAEKRRDGPHQLLLSEGGPFTDVELRVSGRVFRAHRLILACHCEFFLNLFQSGMREAEEGVVHIRDMDADVFERLLNYIYRGELSSELSFEMSKSLLLAANMWQMGDLEAALLNFMVKTCTPQRCLKMFLFVNSGLFCDQQQQLVKQQIEKVLVETVRDRWHMIVSPANHLDCEKDDYVAALADLDLDSLRMVLSLKSDQEEIADFSFSFNQSDLCLAVVQWVKYDVRKRLEFLPELSIYFCQHQINANATNALAALMSEIAGVGGITLEMNPDCCRGFWCPNRKISGLVIAHAWSPHPHNKITSDHIFYYFTIPKHMSSYNSRPLHTDFFYDLGQFGELGDGEKHLLMPNNCLSLSSSNNAHMLLTFDNGTLSGTVIDPVASGYQCGNHHSLMYRFCPSTISQCKCEQDRISICSGSDGFVYVVACPTCQKSGQSYDPCCETFKIIEAPRAYGSSSNLCNSVSVVSESTLYNMGGYFMDPGSTFSYVYCSYDLQEETGVAAGSGVGAPGYKAGHSRVTTALGHLRDTPAPNLVCYTKCGSEWSSSFGLPMPLGDAATAVHKGELYLAGGFEVSYDSELQLFYQKPRSCFWIYSLTGQTWRVGPELPVGITRGTLFVFQERLYFSGGAFLKINGVSESNQIYEYMTNTKVLCLDPSVPKAQWEVVLDLGHFASTCNDHNYAVLSIFPADITLTRLKVRKDHLGSKFMVKYVNINFPSGGTRRDEFKRI